MMLRGTFMTAHAESKRSGGGGNGNNTNTTMTPEEQRQFNQAQQVGTGSDYIRNLLNRRRLGR